MSAIRYRLSRGAAQTMYKSAVPCASSTFLPSFLWYIWNRDTAANVELAADAFNSLVIYNSLPVTSQTVAEYWQANSDVIDEVRAQRLRYFVEYPDTDQYRMVYVDGRARRDTSLIAMLKDDPYLLGYFMTEEMNRYLVCDEREEDICHRMLTGYPDEYLDYDQIWAYTQEERYDWFRTIDADHPYGIMDTPWGMPRMHTGEIDSTLNERWRAVNTAFDFIAHNRHISGFDTLGSVAQSVSELYNKDLGVPYTVRECTRLVEESKPNYFLVPAYKQYDGDEVYRPFPTAEQARAMAFAAIIHGATGVGWFTFDTYKMRLQWMMGIHPDPPAYFPEQYNEETEEVEGLVATDEEREESKALWNEIKSVTSTLSAMAPVIYSPTSKTNYEVHIHESASRLSADYKADVPIRCVLKEYRSFGTTYLYMFAVNLDDSDIDVLWRFPFQPTVVRSVGEEGTKTIKPRGFIDSFAGQESRIYLIESVPVRGHQGWAWLR